MAGSPSSDDAAAPGSPALVLPGVGLLLAGSLTVLWLGWHHLAPTMPPFFPAFVVACLAMGLVEFSLAATFALSPTRPPDAWRPLVVGGILLLGVAVGLTSHARRGVAMGVTVLILALVARAAETLGHHLASSVRMSSGYGGGAWRDWGCQGAATRRIVLETWVASTLAAMRVGGWAVTAALAAMAAGGLLVVAGANLEAAQRTSADGGSSWNWMDRVRAWRGVGALTAVLLAVAVLVPGLPPILSRQVGDLFAKAVQWLLSPADGRTRHATTPHVPPPLLLFPSSVGIRPGRRPPQAVPAHAAHLGAVIEALQWLIHLTNRVLDSAFLLRAVVLLWLIVGAIVLLRAFWTHRITAGGAWANVWQRLWGSLRRVFAFWRWFQGLGAMGGERLARRSSAEDGGGPWRPGMAAQAPAGLLDPRRAIRAHYRRFLRTAADAGQGRNVAETPAVFALRMEEFLGADAEQARALTRAYEEARYSDHIVSAGLAARAQAAVWRLMNRIGGRSARLFGRPRP